MFRCQPRHQPARLIIDGLHVALDDMQREGGDRFRHDGHARLNDPQVECRAHCQPPTCPKLSINEQRLVAAIAAFSLVSGSRAGRASSTTAGQNAMPRTTGRYTGCYVRATGSGDLPTVRWRVTRTFTPAAQTPVGTVILPESVALFSCLTLAMRYSTVIRSRNAACALIKHHEIIETGEGHESNACVPYSSIRRPGCT
jgi:hypothetical protein